MLFFFIKLSESDYLTGQSGDNTRAQKIQRAYRRLIMSVISQDDLFLIEIYINELEELIHQRVFLKHINKIAKKYVVHSQAGKTVLVLKSSPIGKILTAKASIAEKELNRARRKEEYLKKFGAHIPKEYDDLEL